MRSRDGIDLRQSPLNCSHLDTCPPFLHSNALFALIVGRSHCCLDHSAPAEVENFQAVSETPNTILVTWNKTAIPRGVVSGYTVKWNELGHPTSMYVNPHTAIPNSPHQSGSSELRLRAVITSLTHGHCHQPSDKVVRISHHTYPSAISYSHSHSHSCQNKPSARANSHNH